MIFESDKLQQRIKVVTTGDGSQTLSVDGGVEHYHSTNGAVAEALHVYIDAGLAASAKNPINIFEVGFGTGLNAMLACKYAVENGVKVYYTSIERYPLEADVVSLLTYPEEVGLDRTLYFESLHAAPWNVWVNINPYFSIQKVEENLESYKPRDPIDVVFFDAFSPDLQPDLWSYTVFSRLFEAMNDQAILTTYSSKGVVKRTLREVGFSVKRLNGPKGKRHMLLAQK